MMERFADDLWLVARPQRFWGVETGTRMTVVRLSDGGLFVHCPVALDDATRSAVDALGPVRAVVSSSLFHHLYVLEWKRAYPDALYCACPGLERKRPDVPWNRILGDTPVDAWSADLDQVYFSARFEDEVVFFHRKTRTLICADALLNLRHHPSRATRLVALLMWNRAPGTGYLEYVAVRNRKAAREQVDRMLAWDIERIVLAHGQLIERDGERVLRNAYDWL